jgi:hypothetical protein
MTRGNDLLRTKKKKGPLAIASGPSLGRKRPRRAAIAQKRYRTATICDRAAQSASVFESFPMQISQVWQNNNKTIEHIYSFIFNGLLKYQGTANHLSQTIPIS